jgi:hypothetical protein
MATLFGFTRSRSGPGGGTPSRLRKPESEEHQEDKSGVSASTWSGVVCTLLGSGSPDFTWLRPSLQMSKSMDDWDSMLQEIKKWHATVVQWTVFRFGTVTCFATLKPPVLLPSHKVTVHRCFHRVEVSGSGSALLTHQSKWSQGFRSSGWNHDTSTVPPTQSVVP